MQALTIGAHNPNPKLMPIPPLNQTYTNAQLLAVIWQWGKRYNKPGFAMENDDDDEEDLNMFGKRPSMDNMSDSLSEEQKRHSSMATSEAPKKRSDLPCGEYKGKAERVDVFRGDFNRKLVHFFLGLKKYIPTAVRDIFTATTRRPIREPTPVETECLTHAYCLHAFLSAVPDLEKSMRKPYAAGLRYKMSRLYVLIKIEIGVPKPFELRTKAWDHFKVLLNDYTTMAFGDDDELQEDVSNLISVQLKTARIQYSLEDINAGARVSKHDSSNK